jgi:hypothetical protein
MACFSFPADAGFVEWKMRKMAGVLAQHRKGGIEPQRTQGTQRITFLFSAFPAFFAVKWFWTALRKSLFPV